MINLELIQISFLRFTRKDMTVTSSLSSWISIAVTLISFNSEKIVESKTGKGVALTGTNNHSAADPGWSSGGVGPLYQTWGCNVSFTKTKICLTTGSHTNNPTWVPRICNFPTLKYILASSDSSFFFSESKFGTPYEKFLDLSCQFI